jgi:AMP-binding enzyme
MDRHPQNGSSFLTPLAASFVNTTSRFGKRTALWVGGQDYSYNDLRQLASQLAGGFPAPSRDGHDTCAIFAHRSVVAYAGILPCHFMRHAYVALTPIQPIGRSQAVVAQSQPTVVISDSACLQGVPMLLQKLEKPIVVLLPDQKSIPIRASFGLPIPPKSKGRYPALRLRGFGSGSSIPPPRTTRWPCTPSPGPIFA